MLTNTLFLLTKRLLCLLLCLSVCLGALLTPAAATAADTATTTAKVVLRKAADKESKALQTLPEGEEVTVLSKDGSWYKVRYGSYTGYIMKKYLNVTTAKEAAASRIKALGAAPGLMRIGDENSDVEKLQRALEILGYYDGKIDGIYGEGTAKAVKAYQKDEGLEADGYAGTATVKSIFGSCRSTSLTTQAEPGSKGSGSTSSGSRATAKAKTVSDIADIGSAPATSRPGDSGTKVVKLQQALECLGYYDGVIDGDYGDGTTAAVKRFQTKRGMKADGIAGESTIRVLFGAKAAGSTSTSGSSQKYKTEVLDWFEDNVTRVIPKNARFTIKDVKTGKTFEAVRWSGSNHIDAEPRTAADTAKFKEIYGGSWSWRRRPILIMYNGHVYAASMNGMPHGTTTISSNNFAGHFCIHFKNSKTHETDRVDEDHQAAVTTASRASW